MIVQKKSIKLKARVGDVELKSGTVYFLKIPLVEPFVISLGRQDYYEGVIVELSSNEATGLGEGVTVQQITGETPESIFQMVQLLLSYLDGKDFESLESFSRYLDRSIYGNSASKNALDMSFHDLMGKVYGLSVTKILGGALMERPTSLTIPIGTVEDNLRILKKYKERKVKIIKVKVGSDPSLDAERIKAISDNLESWQRFYADANQGYSLSDAVKIGKLLYDRGALFFEQPLNRHDLNNLRELRRRTGIPIALDESVSSPFDVVNSIVHEAVDIVNVKLTKSGGLRNSFKALIVAQAYGIDGMVGCMVESKLGITASLAVANSLDNVKYTDLDGYFFLESQPFEGGVEYEEGMNKPKEGPGLAVVKNNIVWGESI